MNKTTEALKLAEEALLNSKPLEWGSSARIRHEEALAAIREALADHIPDATKMVAEPVMPTHEQMMAGYEIACGYGVMEGRAFDLAEKMFNAFQLSAEPAKQEPVAWADECRITLVTAIHMLSSDFENALYAFREDVEARKVAEGSIAFARSRAEKWNWNGCAAPVQPVKQEPVANLFEAKKKAFEQLKLEVKTPEDKWTVSDSINFFGFYSHGFEAGLKYAAPVDAKAIRAEALEEAEEIAKTIGGSFAEEFLAAIKELK